MFALLVKTQLVLADGSNGPLAVNSFYSEEQQGAGLFTHMTTDDNNLGGIRGDGPANILPVYSSAGACQYHFQTFFLIPLLCTSATRTVAHPLIKTRTGRQ
mmetsp:Transcript_4379/g.6452  ORF Transcript_4379/g.6452 Transcript_4379/m.6452 type:complete len:101 (+) Transcript_4379:174-476(+)